MKNMEIREQLVKRFGLMEAEEILQAPVSRQCKVCGGTKEVTALYFSDAPQVTCPRCNGTEEEIKSIKDIVGEWTG